ncbi:MAG TPA: hypothetical protein EYP72_01870 [Rhodospirillales bacterium]|nr:hypothetical protein [Rhodospirillales bacterium]
MSLEWVEAEGGLKGMMARVEANASATFAWADTAPWIEFLAKDPTARSTTSVCLSVTDPWLQTQNDNFQADIGKIIADLLEKEGVAYDIKHYVLAPPGLRIWNGMTVETSDLEALFPWLDWAWATIKAEASGEGDRA